jgi:hypothetical protein
MLCSNEARPIPANIAKLSVFICCDAIFFDEGRNGLAMTIRIIPILAVAIMIGPSLANGSPACMTESEARAKFPKAHLVWFGTNHCWTFGVVPVHSRRPVLAAEPVPSPRPEIVRSSTVTGAQCRYSPCE